MTHEQIGIGRTHAVHDIGDQPSAGCDTLAYLSDKYLEAFPAQRTRRILVTRWQWRRDGEIVANEQRYRFRHDGGVAVEPIELAADPIETPYQRAVAACVALGIEKPVEGCVDNRRTIGPGPLCRKGKPFGNMIGQVD